MLSISANFMKILFFSIDTFGANGGIAKYNDDLLLCLSKNQKISATMVISRRANYENIAVPSKIFYNAHSHKGKLSFVLQILLLMVQTDIGYDLIICAHNNLLPYAYLLAKLKNIPVWCEIYGIDAWNPHHSFIVNRLLPKISKFITISQYTKHRFIKWSQIAKEKVVILPPSFNSDKFQTGPKPDYLLNRYGLKEKKVLLTLARLDSQERYKGFDEVIEVLPALLAQIPNLVYVIAGDGRDKERLKNKVVSLGLQDNVVFTGFISEDEKQDHYRLADVFVMSGRGEGFGIVYLEAMACGIPVVASKVDGSRDAVRDGQLGILVDPDIPEEVMHGILSALTVKDRKPPPGLEYFSVANFQLRLNNLLEMALDHDER